MYFNFLILISPRDALRTIRTISRPVFMCVFISLSVSLAPVLYWNQWCDLRPSVLGQDRSETKRFGLGLGLAGLMLIVSLILCVKFHIQWLQWLCWVMSCLGGCFCSNDYFSCYVEISCFSSRFMIFAGSELMTKKQHSAKVTQKKHYSPMEMFKKLLHSSKQQEAHYNATP